jgi:hypothetical protein
VRYQAAPRPEIIGLTCESTLFVVTKSSEKNALRVYGAKYLTPSSVFFIILR